MQHKYAWLNLQAFARLNDSKRELTQRQERLELAEEAFAAEKVCE